MENGLEVALDGELGHSKYDYRNIDTDNSRNGHSAKTLRTSFGEVDVSIPHDRKGEFDPQVLKMQNAHPPTGRPDLHRGIIQTAVFVL